MKDGESVEALFSADLTVGFILGSLGSVKVSWNRGKDWGYIDNSEIENFLGILHFEEFITCKNKNNSYTVLVFEDDSFLFPDTENVYLLEKFDSFANWEKIPILQLEGMFQKVGETIRGSNFLQNLPSIIRESEQIAGNLIENDNQPENLEDKDRSDKSIIPFDSLTVNRIVTLTLLFFLARVLFQYAGYYLRLASFCDSRSDALLLAEDFAEEKSKNFDNLVDALSPDFHKFASIPNNIVANLRSVKK